jgi:integrase
MRVNLTGVFVEAAKAAGNSQADYWDARLPGFCLRVAPSGRKTWAVMYRHHGVQRRLALGTYPILGLADGRKLARDTLREVQSGNDPAELKRQATDGARRERAERESRSFAALAERFIEKHAKARNRTWRGAERTIQRELLPRWGKLAAGEVTRRNVIEVVESVAERGSGIMANRLKALVSKIFNFALSEKDPVVSVNPAYGVKNPTPERQRDRVLSEPEIRALWLALNEEPPKIAAIFRLALLTAQRKGEVLRLRWGELDLDAGWWTLPAERSKNKLSHRVPLGPQALAILRELKAAASDPAYVFPGSRPGPTASLSKPVRRIKERAGLEDFRFHDLRRTAASHMTGLGVPRLVVGKILNHAEREVTAVYDRHSYDRDKQRALLAWDHRLEKTVSREQSIASLALVS